MDISLEDKIELVKALETGQEEKLAQIGNIDISSLSDTAKTVAGKTVNYLSREVRPGVFVPCQYFCKMCDLEDGKVPEKYLKATVEIFGRLADNGLIEAVLCGPSFIPLASGNYDVSTGEFTLDTGPKRAACFFFVFPSITAFPNACDEKDTRDRLNLALAETCGSPQFFWPEGVIGDSDWGNTVSNVDLELN